jgi:acyl-CoA synthetase (AMP-forming)/AMP-acid ligase II
MNNWFDHILFQTRSQPEKPALVMEDRVVTYAMLGAGIESCARHIGMQGISGQLPAAVLIKNPIRHLTICLALFRLGIVAISLEHAQTGIRDLKFAAVLGDGDAGPFVDPGNRLIDVTDSWFAPGSPTDAVPSGFHAATQTCRVSLTSGATGAPKSVAHSIVDVGRRIQYFIDVNWNFALCLPGLSSNWGFTTACAALATGRTLCFAQSPFQAVRMIELFSIDFVMASAEQVLALARVARKSNAQVRSLRTVWFGGSVPSRALLEAVMTDLCNNALCRYAASEIGLIAQATAREILSNPGLVGRPVPGVEVVILDSQGRRCPPEAIGSVRARIKDDGIGKASGDVGDSTPWIDLGDAGWLTSGGQLYVVGRTPDIGMIGSGTLPARQLSPLYEIEHILRLGLDATDVAAVIIEQRESSARPWLWIGIVGGKDASIENLTPLLRTRGVDHEIELFDLEAIPRGANGKVNREHLKMLMLASKERKSLS